jgi:hypothetical protein
MSNLFIQTNARKQLAEEQRNQKVKRQIKESLK